MKSILALTTLVAALCASADSDQYLYWMISDQATVGGQSLRDVGASFARVRVEGATDYLNLYSELGGENLGKYYPSTDYFADPVALYAGAFAGDGITFLVELYSDQSFAEDTMVGVAFVPYASEYITSGGMGQPPKFVDISSFYAVPEPTSGLLLLLGVAGLALRRKRVQLA